MKMFKPTAKQWEVFDKFGITNINDLTKALKKGTAKSAKKPIPASKKQWSAPISGKQLVKGTAYVGASGAVLYGAYAASQGIGNVIGNWTAPSPERRAADEWQRYLAALYSKKAAAYQPGSWGATGDAGIPGLTAFTPSGEGLPGGSMLPIALIGLGGLYLFTRPKKKGRK